MFSPFSNKIKAKFKNFLKSNSNKNNLAHAT